MSWICWTTIGTLGGMLISELGWTRWVLCLLSKDCGKNCTKK